MKNPKKFRKGYMFLMVVFCLGAICGGIYKNVLKDKNIKFAEFYSSEETVKDEYEFNYDDIDSIKIDSDIADIEIKEGSDFTVKYKFTEGYEPDVKLDGNVLSIKQRNPKATINGAIESEITITVPKKAKISIIDVQVALGSVKLDEITAEKIDIDASLGEVQIKNADSNKITIDASLGNVEVSGSYDELDVDASLGNINVNTDKPENKVDLNLNADLGSIQVNGKKVSNY